MNKRVLTAMFFVFGVLSVSAQETPTMGWSSWNSYGFQISESIIKKEAQALKSKGFDKVGYKYVNIDDGYFGGRDADGKLLINKERFPNGMKVVVDYIHNRGLLAGIYSDGGHNTCASYHGGDKSGIGVGLYEHDQQDCDLFFKELDFDFIKVDFCGGVNYHNSENLNLDEKKRYTEIHNAIVKAGKEGVRMNVCRWAYPGTWVTDVATSWRTTGDINCSWGSVKDIIKENLCMSAYCRNGNYNDMDMLEVGRGLSTEEDRTHFAMWCIMSSPLLIGCKISEISTTSAAAKLMKNEELIALNQDTLCTQAYVADYHDGCYVLVKDLITWYDTIRAVALYNPNDEAKEFTLDFEKVDLGGRVKMRDLINKKDLEDAEGTFTVKLPAHGTRVYKCIAEKRLERTLYEAETAYIKSYQELTWPSKGSYDNNEKASGGFSVGWLGKSTDCSLLFEHVNSLSGGKYTLTVAYLSGESRSMTVNVNGKDVKTLTGCNSGSFTDKVAKKTLSINLDKGNNTIKIYNKSGDMPNMDYITLKLVEPLVDAIDTPKASKKSKGIFGPSGEKRQSLSKGINIVNDDKGTKKVYVPQVDNEK